MLSAETLIMHTDSLRWVDRAGQERIERQAAWTARTATTKAWRRARSLMTSGEAKAFRIEHTQRAYDDSDVRAVNDPFEIPAAA